jgi:DNA helicase-2/ATP-dependent DNA helicase PcrA
VVRPSRRCYVLPSILLEFQKLKMFGSFAAASVLGIDIDPRLVRMQDSEIDTKTPTIQIRTGTLRGRGVQNSAIFRRGPRGDGTRIFAKFREFLFVATPAIPELFGFGKTVHTSVGKLHELFPNRPPTPAEARQVAEDTFHLKHIRPSSDPVNRPGPYENAMSRAAELVEQYATDFQGDFQRRRQIEARLEIPVQNAVVSGSIDLMVLEDNLGQIVDACVIDFKAIEGGDDPAANVELDWTTLALQVQLYAVAAHDVLGEAIRAGHVHLLKDSQRVEVPVDANALIAARRNIEWAVAGIIDEDFPMRPEAVKCEACDFRQLCPKTPQQFRNNRPPPPISVPGQAQQKMVDAFALFDANFAPQ